MKSFILDRHTDSDNPELKKIIDEKIPVYSSQADAESDLDNLDEGQIIGVTDSNAEDLAAPVDEVSDGVLKPVTSNAVYDAILEAITPRTIGNVISDVTIQNGTLSQAYLWKFGKLGFLRVTGKASDYYFQVNISNILGEVYHVSPRYASSAGATTAIYQVDSDLRTCRWFVSSSSTTPRMVFEYIGILKPAYQEL